MMTKELSPKQRANRVRKVLLQNFPDAYCELNHSGPLQLLIATILSAQCTDARVNMVTPKLFERFPDVHALASAKIADIEKLIQSTGFFRNKAKNIQACCQQLIDKHGSDVPTAMEDLVVLPGVGRKTANVVRGDAFGIPGITVDTHVGRLSRRLGLTIHEDPVKVEMDLNDLIPEKEWTEFSHRMIFHGRRVCFARNPDCKNCDMLKFCPQVGVKKEES
jgi:endonuclease III